MKSRLAALIGAALFMGATTARADYERRIVGKWLTNATEDRFGDGGTYSAIVADGSTGLVVRCIRKDLSLAVFHAGRDPNPFKEGDPFAIKFKVDQQPVVETVGEAIDGRLIQVVTEASLVKAIRDGREAAVRLSNSAGVVTTSIFKTDGAVDAFADLSKECPLD